MGEEESSPLVSPQNYEHKNEEPKEKVEENALSLVPTIHDKEKISSPVQKSLYLFQFFFFCILRFLLLFVVSLASIICAIFFLLLFLVIAITFFLHLNLSRESIGSKKDFSFFLFLGLSQ